MTRCEALRGVGVRQGDSVLVLTPRRGPWAAAATEAVGAEGRVGFDVDAGSVGSAAGTVGTEESGEGRTVMLSAGTQLGEGLAARFAELASLDGSRFCVLVRQEEAGTGESLRALSLLLRRGLGPVACSDAIGEELGVGESVFLFVRAHERITAFQSRVFAAAMLVPRGRVTTYKRGAEAVVCGSSQAVGQALKHNPFAPWVPCHRVIASDLTLGGFAGKRQGAEIRRKRALLASEGVGFSHGVLSDPRQLWRPG